MLVESETGLKAKRLTGRMSAQATTKGTMIRLKHDPWLGVGTVRGCEVVVGRTQMSAARTVAGPGDP